MTSTSGRADLTAIATPAHSPPPPTGITTRARSGTSSSSSSPSEPWPATTSGSSNGCTKASPPSSARSMAACRQSSTDPPPTWIVAPWPRAASTLAIGASVGTNTSQAAPRIRAAAASACAWLPAEAVTTPLAHPCSPSAASLAATPRTLNEPVRCRFSALSTTSPPATSENVREDSTGVRRAISPTAGRAARMSASVGERKDRVDLDLGPERKRGHADRGARGRVALEVRLVRLVDVGEHGDVGDVDAHPHRVRQRRARRLGDDRQVVEAAAGLVADVALDELARSRVDRRLPGAEHEAVRDVGVGVGPGGRRTGVRVHDSPMVAHPITLRRAHELASVGKPHTMPNRLAHETSPYLLQHAENPVDWHAWGDEDLQRAREEDKPLLVSIGYSACHWCHVMERESFEDPETAAVMNELFVCVKVDREERPDVDDIYMEAVQAMTGQGGWPMTVFLTPDGAPFYGGTYFPPTDRHGLPSFRRLLQGVADAWRGNRTDLEERGGALAEQIGAAARLTLDAMAAGGMFDQLGGGFSRYSVDRYWLVPHFEKMLYDNAQLLRTYARAWLRKRNPEYA